MGVMGIQWLIATLAYVGFLLAGFTWLRNRTNLNQTIPTTNERLAQYQRLLADFPLTPENAPAANAAPPPANAPPAQAPDVSDKEPKTAEMLLDQSKIAYDRMFADRSSMETRAGTLVGLAAAATGASAFITGGRGITFTPLLGAAAIFAILSLSCLLFILRAKYNPQPNPASFVFTNTVWDEAMHFRICLVMAEDYSVGCVVLSRDMKKDSAAIFVATACLVAATAMVLANSAFPVKQPPSVTKCFIKAERNQLVQVECDQ